MKKSSTYSNKRRQQPGGFHSFNAGEWMNAIQRSRAYTDETVPGAAPEVTGSMEAAVKTDNMVSMALNSLLEYVKPADPERAFDLLAEAMGVAVIRAIQINPDEASNPVLPIMSDGKSALERTIKRFERTGEWGLYGSDREAVHTAIDTYSEILLSSSPAQMAKAQSERIKVLKSIAKKAQKEIAMQAQAQYQPTQASAIEKKPPMGNAVVGGALMRVRSEADAGKSLAGFAAALHGVECLAERFDLKSEFSREVLEWWLAPNCEHCQGRKCQKCQWKGKRAIPHGGLGRKLVVRMEEAVNTWRRSAKAMLHASKKVN